MTPLTLRAQHDPTSLSAELLETGRRQIPNFLTEESANYLHGLLHSHEHWHLTYNEGSENYETDEQTFKALPPQQQHRFTANIYRRAREGFQYLFWQYYITAALKNGENPGHPMHAVNDWVNSEEFLGFMRNLTKRDDITHSDSYASWYSPGHFLTKHDDRHPRQKRVAAWVLSMTPEWNENWGGHLAFFDKTGSITEAFKPAFNTFNIFLVPQDHAVQLIAPYAGKPRTSFLGWLQSH
jgi:SM-20-related protein